MAPCLEKEGTVAPVGMRPCLAEKSDDFLDEILQLGLADGPGDLVNHLAALEEDEGRDRPDTEFTRGRGVVVDIHFGDDHLALELIGKLVDDRTDGLAGTAPHQGAQKSTRQGVALPTILVSNSLSEICSTLSLAIVASPCACSPGNPARKVIKFWMVRRVKTRFERPFYLAG